MHPTTQVAFTTFRLEQVLEVPVNIFSMCNIDASLLPCGLSTYAAKLCLQCQNSAPLIGSDAQNVKSVFKYSLLGKMCSEEEAVSGGAMLASKAID